MNHFSGVIARWIIVALEFGWWDGSWVCLSVFRSLGYKSNCYKSQPAAVNISFFLLPRMIIYSSSLSAEEDKVHCAALFLTLVPKWPCWSLETLLQNSRTWSERGPGLEQMLHVSLSSVCQKTLRMRRGKRQVQNAVFTSVLPLNSPTLTWAHLTLPDHVIPYSSRLWFIWVFLCSWIPTREFFLLLLFCVFLQFVFRRPSACFLFQLLRINPWSDSNWFHHSGDEKGNRNMLDDVWAMCKQWSRCVGPRDTCLMTKYSCDASLMSWRWWCWANLWENVVVSEMSGRTASRSVC